MIRFRLSVGAMVIAVLAACATDRQPTPFGSSHTYRSIHGSDSAARCFARNAEEHSSALVAEIANTPNGGVEVIVRVKNGVPYATATFRPALPGSVGAIVLMVSSNAGSQDLFDRLVEGC